MLERFGWVRIRCRSAEVPLFGILLVKRDQRTTSSAFLRPLPIILVAQEILNRCHQEATEATPLTSGFGQVVLLQQIGEEALREILSSLRRVAPLANERVDWKPIVLTQPGQRRFGL